MAEPQQYETLRSYTVEALKKLCVERHIAVYGKRNYCHPQEGGKMKWTINIYEQLEKKNVTLEQLFSMAKNPSMVRTGSTQNPNKRRSDYVYKDGYSGVMYLAETTDMKLTEDQLLKQQDFRDNIQKKSNQVEGPGYVYLIKEQ